MPHNAAKNGFTLIEILVVLVIIGLMAALAVFTMGGSSQQRELEAEVQGLYLRLQVVSEQAVLNNLEAGLVIEADHYRFVMFDDETQDWRTSPERLFQAHALPLWLSVDTALSDDIPRLTNETNRLQPSVVFFSSGESTAFEIELMVRGQAMNSHRLYSDGFGLIRWQKPGARADGP
ncbi:MAG TPA: type II secretion system minor pseudopilin GspH [Marinobacter sp.]|nr:type II secretion system minor pseudopilin GspH [Marinobacter sp.]